MNYLICGAQVVLPESVSRADVLVKDGVISRIAPNIQEKPDVKIIRAEGQYLLPGFIDIHNHGAAGFDFSFGTYDHKGDSFSNHEEIFAKGLLAALKHYREHGVTKVLLTSMAAPLEPLKQSFENLSSFLKDHPSYRSMVHGINLEGTFLKDPAYAGAQNADHFYPLDWNTLNDLRDSSDDLIKIINIPPEHGPTCLPFIRSLREEGMVVAGGHSAAYADEFEPAVKAGLSLAVHFLNGPSRSFSKSFRGGGAVETMLKSDEVSLEIICDGYHVDPAYVRDVIERKGADRVIMITDSMFANGLKDLRQFSLLDMLGTVSDNGQYLQPVGKKDTLFGSVLNSDVGFTNVLNWLTTDIKGVWHRHHSAYDLDQAIVQCSRMFSGNPARILSLAESTGMIAEGYASDLILAEISHEHKYELEIKDVFSAKIKDQALSHT